MKTPVKPTKPLLSYCDRVVGRGLSLGPGVDAPGAVRLIDRHISGTTSKPHQFAVLWMGEHSALVYWKPNDGKDRMSPIVSVYRLFDGKEWEVHDSDPNPAESSKSRLWSWGRLAPGRVLTLVNKAKDEDMLIPGRSKKEESEERAREQAQEDARRQAEDEAADLARKRERILELAESLKDSLGAFDRKDVEGPIVRTLNDARELALLVCQVGAP